MKFETKYNKGDHVWYMKNNNPTEVEISAINIFYVNTDQDKIMYSGWDVKNRVSWIDHQYLHENMIYKSKQELLNSL